jgi:hypothetical protein
MMVFSFSEKLGYVMDIMGYYLKKKTRDGTNSNPKSGMEKTSQPPLFS